MSSNQGDAKLFARVSGICAFRLPLPSYFLFKFLPLCLYVLHVVSSLTTTTFPLLYTVHSAFM